MSYVFIEYNNESIDYHEEVSPSWGQDGTLMLQKDDDNYSWINLAYVVNLRVTSEPMEVIEYEFDAEEEEEVEDGTDSVAGEEATE